MSSLGVLLGAICAGLLLYCTCSYAGLSSRSSTTLENYNFELYDGIKHKVKMNHQKCCSEAWWVPGDHPWHCARWGGLAGGTFLLFSMGTECHNREWGEQEWGEALLLPPGLAAGSHSTRTEWLSCKPDCARRGGDWAPCLLVHLNFLLMWVAGMW